MKPAYWFALAVAAVVCVVLAGLSWRPVEASSGDMPTVAKKPAARRRAGSAKKPAAVIPGLSPRRSPPPPVGTVADVRKMKDFGKGADWDLIEAAHAARDL